MALSAVADARARRRSLCCILLGVAGLLLKGHYAGPGAELVHSYGGNVSASFAVFFLATRVPARVRRPPAGTPAPLATVAAGVAASLRRPSWQAAALALAAVEIFEVTDGFFGAMSNTYDPMDLVANAVGIAIAMAVDALIARVGALGKPPGASHPPAAREEVGA